MPDLTETIYITNGYGGTIVEGAVLRCSEHPNWEKDVDGAPIDTAMNYAIEHGNDEHRD